MVSFLFFFFEFSYSNDRKTTFFSSKKKYRALFFNGMTLCIIIALFMIIRKPCERVYSARLKSRLRYDEYDGKYFYNTERLVPASGYYNEEKPPDQTLSSFWSWIKFLFNHTEVQVFHDLGLDEVVMTKVHVLAMEIFSVILVLNVPLYLYYAINSETRFEWNHSMADVEPGSWILWIYFCFVWLKTCVCLFFLWRHTKSFVRLRQEHLANSIDERLEDCEELHPRDREILSVRSVRARSARMLPLTLTNFVRMSIVSLIHVTRI